MQHSLKKSFKLIRLLRTNSLSLPVTGELSTSSSSISFTSSSGMGGMSADPLQYKDLKSTGYVVTFTILAFNFENSPAEKS
jgi:hypothetical protein